MKKALKSPVFNAVCISLFTAFYALIFLTGMISGNSGGLPGYEGGSAFWKVWSDFLTAGNQSCAAWMLIAVTVIVVILLLLRRRPYDEYHTSILSWCLVAASMLTLAAIAVFYLVILSEPVWFLGKFTLFILVHWGIIVFANLTYVMISRWR